VHARRRAARRLQRRHEARLPQGPDEREAHFTARATDDYGNVEAQPRRPDVDGGLRPVRSRASPVSDLPCARAPRRSRSPPNPARRSSAGSAAPRTLRARRRTPSRRWPTASTSSPSMPSTGSATSARRRRRPSGWTRPRRRRATPCPGTPTPPTVPHHHHLRPRRRRRARGGDGPAVSAAHRRPRRASPGRRCAGAAWPSASPWPPRWSHRVRLLASWAHSRAGVGVLAGAAPGDRPGAGPAPLGGQARTAGRRDGCRRPPDAGDAAGPRPLSALADRPRGGASQRAGAIPGAAP
jgi:hypothetical protein